MGISDKTRKVLWARSGNRCAFCKMKLIRDRTSTDSEAIVGDECHIVAQGGEGPRSDVSWTEEQIHHYDNLILLCKVHHKVVDDQPHTFTQDALLAMKKQHELWVDTTLEPHKINREHSAAIAIRLTRGQDVIAVLSDAYLFDFGNSEPEIEEEVELISDFSREMHDYLDIAGALDSGDVVRLGYTWTQKIKELEATGLQVYGAKYKKAILIGGQKEDWLTAYIRIVRHDHPDIHTLNA